MEADALRLFAFDTWMNSVLSTGGYKGFESDLVNSLSDGTHLMHLIQTLSGKTPPQTFKDNPTTDEERLNNVKAVLALLSECGIWVNTQPDAIIKGDQNAILDLIWKIILHFRLYLPFSHSLSPQKRKKVRYDDDSKLEFGKKELLSWVNGRIKDRGTVSDLHMSWFDGLNFLALLSSALPDKVDWGSVRLEDGTGNLDKAFDIAETELKVPRMLNIDNMTGWHKGLPSEQVVLAYIAELSHAIMNKESDIQQIPPSTLGQIAELREASLEDHNIWTAGALREKKEEMNEGQEGDSAVSEKLLRDAEMEKERLMENINRLEKQRNHAIEEKSMIEADLIKARDLSEALRSDLDKAKSDLLEKDKERKEAIENLARVEALRKQLEGQLADANKRLAHSQRFGDANKKELAYLRNFRTTSLYDADILSARIEQLENRLSELTGERDNADKLLKALKKERSLHLFDSNILSARIEQLESRLRSIRDQRQETKDRLQLIEKEYENSLKDCNVLSARIEQIQLRLTDVMDQKNSLLNQLSLMKKERQVDLHDANLLSSRIELLQQRLNDVKDSKENLMNRLTEMEGVISALEEMKETLSFELKSVHRKFHQSEEEKQCALKNVDLLTDENERLSHDIKRFELERNSLLDSLANIDSELKHLRAENIKLQRDSIDISGERAKLNERINMVEEECQNLRNELKEVNQRKALTEDERKKVEEERLQIEREKLRIEEEKKKLEQQKLQQQQQPTEVTSRTPEQARVDESYERLRRADLEERKRIDSFVDTISKNAAGILVVDVIGARSLKNLKSKRGKGHKTCDAYAELSIKSTENEYPYEGVEIARTRIVTDTNRPVWDSQHILHRPRSLKLSKSNLNVSIYDRITEKKLGTARIPLKKLASGEKVVEEWYPVEPPLSSKGKEKKLKNAEVKLSIEYKKVPRLPSIDHSAPSSVV